jgi:integrase
MSPEVKATILFRDAGPLYLESAQRRNRSPLKPAAAKSYSSYLSNHLMPTIGDLPLAQVTNKTVRELIGLLKDRDLATKTIIEIVGFVKIVVGSIVNDEGAPLYPRTWNHEFMDLPTLGKQKQNAYTPDQVEQFVARARKREAALYALLAGSGLRIGEAQAIHINGTEDQTRISPDCRTIFVRKSIWGGVEQAPKTKDAIREVDLCEPLAKFLKDFIGTRKYGYLFSSDSGKPLLQRNILRDSLHRIQKGREAFQSYRMVGTQKVKHILFPAIPGVLGHTEGFHAFRRYRATHLDLSDVPRGIAQFWLGHADKSITDRYVKMQGRIAERRTWAEKAGLGFKLPKKVTSMKGKVKAA